MLSIEEIESFMEDVEDVQPTYTAPKSTSTSWERTLRLVSLSTQVQMSFARQWQHALKSRC